MRRKLAGLMDEADSDVLAYMSFSGRTSGHAAFYNPMERISGEIKRRTEVVGISQNEGAIIWLVGGRP
jgi:putative transposase